MITHRTEPEPDEIETEPGALRARGLYGALYRSGTSRILVLESRRLSAVARPQEYLVEALLGPDARGGIGDEHYQTNKIALISTSGRDLVEFEFFQGDRERGRLIRNLECSNSAAAAAAYALAHRLVDGPRVLTVNRDTGRPITVALAPAAGSAVWDATLWFGTGLFNRRGTALVALDDCEVRCSLVSDGHYFLLAEGLPEARWNAAAARLLADRSLAALSAAHGVDDDHLKIVLYRREGAGARAACFYKGELHRSLPGSGAIVLARHLLLQAPGSGARSVEIASRSARLRVTLADGPIERTAAGLSARVELLMAGWLGNPVR